jgi:hypothetical protein
MLGQVEQAFDATVAVVSLGTAEGNSMHSIVDWDDLSVTLEWKVYAGHLAPSATPLPPAPSPNAYARARTRVHTHACARARTRMHAQVRAEGFSGGDHRD